MRRRRPSHGHVSEKGLSLVSRVGGILPTLNLERLLSHLSFIISRKAGPLVSQYEWSFMLAYFFPLEIAADRIATLALRL